MSTTVLSRRRPRADPPGPAPRVRAQPTTSRSSARPARGRGRRRVADALHPDVVDRRRAAARRQRARRWPRSCASSAPTIGIVVLTMYAGDEQLFGALEAGASRVRAQGRPRRRRRRRGPARRRRPRARSPRPTWPSAMRRRLDADRPAAERRARRRCSGCSPTASAWRRSRKQLYISESTTKTHISKLYEKLGAANRAQALMTALRLGLITQGTSETV